MFSEITELKTIRTQKSALSERERELSKPTLTDMALIPTIYEAFVEYNNGKNVPSRSGNLAFRKQFIFIVLYLYAPSSLAGGKMPDFLRGHIASVLGCNPAWVSQKIDVAVFQYNQYREVRDYTDKIYSIILKKINTPL